MQSKLTHLPNRFRVKAAEKGLICPKCKAVMTSQGVKSVGAGAARLYNVEIYLCPQCGCNGSYDKSVQRVIEIPNF